MLKQSLHSFTLESKTRLTVMIILSLILFILKITIGRFTNSMALVADAFCMMSHFAALTIAFIALQLATNSTTTTRKGGKRNDINKLHKFTFGWIRAEILGGLINIVLLFALCFAAFLGSLKRLLLPQLIVNPKAVLVVACLSLAVNFLGLFLFRGRGRSGGGSATTAKKKRITIEREELLQETGDEEEFHSCPGGGGQSSPTVYKRLTSPAACREHSSPHGANMRGIYLHILEHFLASLGVVFTAMFSIVFKNRYWVVYLDPAYTIVLAVLISYLSYPLFRQTLALFMQSAPKRFKVEELKEGLLRSFPAVLAVHEFHLWHLGGEHVVASAHVVFRDADNYEGVQWDQVKRFFNNQGIDITLQPEFLPAGGAPPENRCFLRCANCDNISCCPSKNYNL